MRTFEFEHIRDCCLAKLAVTESFPFDDTTMVWKVLDKIFAIANVDDFRSVSLKCNPARSIELREQFEGVRPGWHLNKKHWNSVSAELDVDLALVLELVDHSYASVVRGMTKKSRKEHGL